MKSFHFDRLETFIFDRMSKAKIPGLSIAILDGNNIVYARGFGFRDVENGLSATPQTIYGIGSVTKSFTALSIMQLCEKGALNLDDPVNNYVPVKLTVYGEPVRIHHLLTHSSGIPALAYAEAFIRGILGDEASWTPIASYEDMFTFLKDYDDWIECKPGERFFYLNEGYVLLGYIIEKISKMVYEDYVRKNILEPLNMKRSFFARDDVERDPDSAALYIIDKNGNRVRKPFPYGIKSDGGLLSNVIDLTNYLKMYLNRGTFNGRTIASKDSIIEMEKPRVKLPYEIFGGESYGYGWIIYPNFLGHKLIGHSGSVLVSTAYVGYIPERKVGVAILANSSGYPLSHIGMYALALMLGREPEELPFIKQDRILDALTGTYETYKGTMKANVVRKGDILMLEIKGKYVETSTPFIPVKLEEEIAKFYTLEAGRKIEVEFRVKNGRIELIYERYKLRKVGPLV